MKRLSGGLVLLNLTAISLGLTSGEVNITDAGILEELTELRQFIDVNRDFTKGFKNLKPILIEYRSNASKFNGIALGNLSFNTDALHMSIGINTIQADGKMLVVTINVVYEWQDYIGYKVKSAKLTAYETLATGDGTFTGDVGISGDLEVGGDVTITGKINDVSNPSVKPIYCHPITVVLNSASVTGVKAKIDCLIFNNRATAYTSFKEMIAEMHSVSRILATGYTNGAGTSGTPSNTDLHIAYEVYSNGSTTLSVNAVNVSTGADEYVLISGDTPTWESFVEENFADGVNKIN